MVEDQNLTVKTYGLLLSAQTIDRHRLVEKGGLVVRA